MLAKHCSSNARYCMPSGHITEKVSRCLDAELNTETVPIKALAIAEGARNEMRIGIRQINDAINSL